MHKSESQIMSSHFWGLTWILLTCLNGIWTKSSTATRVNNNLSRQIDQLRHSIENLDNCLDNFKIPSNNSCNMKKFRNAEQQLKRKYRIKPQNILSSSGKATLNELKQLAGLQCTKTSICYKGICVCKLGEFCGKTQNKVSNCQDEHDDLLFKLHISNVKITESHEIIEHRNVVRQTVLNEEDDEEEWPLFGKEGGDPEKTFQGYFFTLRDMFKDMLRNCLDTYNIPTNQPCHNDLLPPGDGSLLASKIAKARQECRNPSFCSASIVTGEPQTCHCPDEGVCNESPINITSNCEEEFLIVENVENIEFQFFEVEDELLDCLENFKLLPNQSCNVKDQKRMMVKIHADGGYGVIPLAEKIEFAIISCGRHYECRKRICTTRFDVTLKPIKDTTVTCVTQHDAYTKFITTPPEANYLQFAEAEEKLDLCLDNIRINNNATCDQSQIDSFSHIFKALSMTFIPFDDLIQSNRIQCRAVGFCSENDDHKTICFCGLPCRAGPQNRSANCQDAYLILKRAASRVNGNLFGNSSEGPDPLSPEVNRGNRLHEFIRELNLEKVVVSLAISFSVLSVLEKIRF